jgi:hypothetical protein
MNENIPDIVKDVDCIQETKQYSVKIEHNWSITNIFNQIETKRPGEKIESETFSYVTKSDDSDANNNNNKETKSQLTNDINISYSSLLTLNTEILCNHFLTNALWRLELNRSVKDSSYLSFSTILVHAITNNNNNNNNLDVIYQNINSLLSKTNLILKMKIFLLNTEMNDLFEKKAIEIKIDLKSFFQSLHSASVSQQQLNHQVFCYYYYFYYFN